MENPMQLTGRRVMVTGASSGIGREAAILLSDLGANLVLVGRDQERLNQTLQQLKGSDHRIEPFDLSSGDAILGWFKEVVGRCGPLRGLAHCAGIQSYHPLRVLTTDAMDSMYRANTISAAMLARAFQQRGCFEAPASIVLAASTAGLMGVPANAAYGATKAALLSLARSFAKELASKGIRVNCVVPGLVETEMVARSRELMTPESFQGMIDRHPLGAGQPRDVANAIAFLLADSARWVTGSGLIVDGGLLAG